MQQKWRQKQNYEIHKIQDLSYTHHLKFEIMEEVDEDWDQENKVQSKN